MANLLLACGAADRRYEAMFRPVSVGEVSRYLTAIVDPTDAGIEGARNINRGEAAAAKEPKD